MFAALEALKFRLKVLSVPPPDDLDGFPKVGGMASIPSRAGELESVLAELMPQLDRLHLFLHGHAEIPKAARHPRITPYLASRDHPYRASGKFFGLLSEPHPCLYFGFDDDILYKAGHVGRLTAALKRYRGRAIVGLHGVRYLVPDATFYTKRRRYHFKRALLADRRVDMLGTGTMAFVSTLLPLDPPSWRYGDMDDIMVAIEAEKRSIPRIAIRRPAGSITEIATAQQDGLWRSARRDSTRQTEQLRILLALRERSPG